MDVENLYISRGKIEDKRWAKLLHKDVLDSTLGLPNEGKKLVERQPRRREDRMRHVEFDRSLKGFKAESLTWVDPETLDSFYSSLAMYSNSG